MVSTSCRDCKRPVSVHRHARLGASSVLILLFCLVSLWTRSSHALLRSERSITGQAQPALAVTRSSSSDFVAIYYNLFQKNRQSTLPPVVFKQEVPTEIQTRLSKYSLRFRELPELLKRALLWESGYSLGDNASLVQIRTLCGLSMAEIALSETEFSASSCDTERCSSTSSDRRHAKVCRSDQLLMATKCATTAVDRVSSTSLWSSKALDSDDASQMIPNIQMRRQQWQDPELSQPIHVYAIHTTEQEDIDVCASGFNSGLVIPCVPYQRNNTRWCRPEQSSLMTIWLEAYAQSVFLDNSHSRSTTGSSAAETDRLVLSDLNVSANTKDDHGVYVSPAFQYDGTSSDFAQQFYRRSLADADSAAALDKLTIEQPLPKEIEQRLTNAGLSFGDLPPLLQRALVWDSGYAFAKGDDGSETLRSVYVKCGLAMSDIAMPRESVNSADCEVQTCSSSLDVGSNQSVSHRALSCTNDLIVHETRCAVANADAIERSNRIAVWADGGVGTATPDVNIKKYSVESENASFVLLGIHATQDNLDAGTSSECIDKPSMIIPCFKF
uniref:Uncharacterized protein n=1 Tax=Globisporangium ultimum (strain ATCC 200006 / CBS 805.95 / DAOM BR144) TaxID=431595 RepID=K3X711_GLOUD